MSTNNFPLIWNNEADDGLLGSLFPQGINFNESNSTSENIWKEDWKTRTMSEIQEYFFPEGKTRTKNNITICDTTETFKDTEITNNEPKEEAITLEEVFVNSYGMPRIPLDLGNMAIYFFTSSDGAKLMRARRCAYESVSKNPDVLAIFMETDEGGNIFGSVMDFVVGDKVRALFKEDHWQKIFDFLEKNELHVSRKDTEELIKKGLSHENFLDYILRNGSDWLAKISFAVFDGMSEGFGQIAKGIGGWKFKDEEWDTSHENFSSENAPFIFFEPEYTELKKIRYKNSEMFEEIIANFKNTVETHQDKIPDIVLKPMLSFIDLLEEKTKQFFVTFQENSSVFVNLIKQSNENMNAFLCGFINGFLDFIKSIFDLFAMLFKLFKGATDFALNESYYWNLTLEYIENGIDALSQFDILDFFKKTFTLPVEILANFMSFLTNLAVPSVNFSKIYYFSGYVLLGIVQVILEILFTAGSATLERIFAKGANIIQGIAKKAVGFADDVLQSLDRLISIIKKGSQSFASFIRQILKDFYEWLKSLFKSGKADEVFEEVTELYENLLKLDLEKVIDGKTIKFLNSEKKIVAEIIDNILIFKYSGFGGDIKMIQNKTTTVFGRFNDIINGGGTKELLENGISITGKNPNGINILNINDWTWEKNKQWIIDSANRGDIMRFISDPTDIKNIWKNGIIGGIKTVTGMEIEVLESLGYKWNKNIHQFIKQ